MKRLTPRERAQAAFAIIDRHHDGQSSPCPMFAYTELAAAMNELFGPLPAEITAWHMRNFEREDEL